MRILADENFPRIAVEELRSRGHDVRWVCDELRGSSGELAFRHGLPASCGVMLFRLTPVSPQRLASIIVSALESRQSWDGFFAVVEDACIRIVPLPAKS